jgi:choline O-acetyltransferase
LSCFSSRALPIDRATSREKGQPLCMEQYYRLFSCYRMPGIECDRLIQLRNSKVMHHQVEHVIVAYRNQFFVLNVIINFTRLDEDDIYTLLRRIVQMADDDPWTTDEVGIYTSLPRRSWSNVRTELIKDALNRDSLDLIERCIFLVCLDQSDTDGLEEDDELVTFNKAIKRNFVSLGEQILHGGKNMHNASNRWYDKTMQFIIGTDGLFGLNYEHSPAEAIAVIQLIEHLFKYMYVNREILSL